MLVKCVTKYVEKLNSRVAIGMKHPVDLGSSLYNKYGGNQKVSNNHALLLCPQTT